ncbi:MAG TPA: BBP7 family outer membrane beta-barrel protein [Stellaceae bacterium]|nr:BBP7 family outer membrane beta-barrel protein [Stellaceae bacterium]
MNRSELAAAWVAVAFFAVPLTAQSAPPEPEQSAAADSCGDPACASTSRVWFGGDYLLWHVTGDKLPALVTTSPLGTPQSEAGLLSNATTTVLFGDTRVNDGWRNGGRVQGGVWLNDQRSSAIEANFFGLGSSETTFSANSATIPILARPFLNATTGMPDSQLVAFPSFFAAGQVSAQETNKFLGAGILWRQAIFGDGGDRISALVGYRFLRMTDNLGISQASITPSGSVIGAATIAASDQFQTANNFNGADLGLTGRLNWGPWALDWLAKVGLGVNGSNGSINGATTIAPAGGVSMTQPGGLLALSSNIAQFNIDRFAVAPAGSLKLSYQITPQVRLSAGYELLYWTNVVRPGGVIDTTVNPNLLPNGSGGGPSRPQVQTRGSDVLAHGFNFGLTVDF